MTSLQHMNPTVRGIRPPKGLQSLAAHITQEITLGEQEPFKELIDVSSCDPHKAGMKPITFVRQVLAVCLHPQLLEEKTLPVDVRQRAQRLLEACAGGSVGSYSLSSGICHVKQSIAEFIMRRDGGVPSYAKDIFICAGSQRGLMLVMHPLASGEGDTRTGVLTPMPCPHTLPMLLDEAKVTPVPYRLMEDRGWAVDLVELHRALKTARGHCVPRATYISNTAHGYMEFVNMDPGVIQFLDIMLDTDISTPVTGQLALDLMVNPPKPGDPSYDSYAQEILLTRATLSQNAQRALEFLNALPGMSCQPAMGGIYLYPLLHLPSETTEKAKKLEVEADVLYCQILLEEKGVLLGAGCQHGDTTGNHHLRLCVLVPPDTLEEVLAGLGSFHLRGHTFSA